jgi:hypothetical protein
VPTKQIVERCRLRILDRLQVFPAPAAGSPPPRARSCAPQKLFYGKWWSPNRSHEDGENGNDGLHLVAALDQQLKRGDKALIGNSAYRRYLRITTGRRVFESDPGKLAHEARFDGIFVLRSNARISPLQVVLRYRDLLQVEDLFRTAKALMRRRPIYHSSDAAIRARVFCSFLALVLRKELDEGCQIARLRPEWADVLRELDRGQEIELNKNGRKIIMRTPAIGIIGPLFKAARVALPANIREPAPT